MREGVCAGLRRWWCRCTLCPRRGLLKILYPDGVVFRRYAWFMCTVYASAHSLVSPACLHLSGSVIVIVAITVIGLLGLGLESHAGVLALHVCLNACM